jgi:hypothetical protein
MLVYKSINIFGGNLTDRYVDAKKINAEAEGGWKLIAITAPPNSQNNRYVCGTFVRDEAVVAKNAPTEAAPNPAPIPEIAKKHVGRPAKVAGEVK